MADDERMRVYRDTAAEVQARYARLDAELRDVREESQAGRQALLDRLPPPSSAA